jgi:hypothetical protein
VPLSRRDYLLGTAGLSALKAGLGLDGAKVAQAIMVTEGAFNREVGDLDRGNGSFGPYQFFADKGMLPAFAQSLGVSQQEAGRIAQEHPEVAIDWALRGYLGQAIKAGQREGLSGSRLASYAQRFGQRSEAPERSGANYDKLFGGGQDPIGIERTDGVSGQAQGSGQGTAAIAKGGRATTGADRDLVPNQFGDPSLTAEEAVSACGPAAAVAFARTWGRNPTLREALDLAKTVGWTQAGGMNGLANQEKLVRGMAAKYGIDPGVKTVYGTPDWDAVIHDAMNGNPVTVSTNIHYYVIDGYDPQTGRFHVGQSGQQRTSISSPWATRAQIEADQPNGVMYIDHPLTPGRSVAATVDDGSRDDWRTASRPQQNQGIDWEAEKSKPLATVGASAMDTPQAQTQPRPAWNPYDTPGWRAARAIDTQFNADFADRQQRTWEEASKPVQRSPLLDITAPEASPGLFDDVLDPKRGVPGWSSVAAPTRRRYF